ncbi:MAG: penicillin acylase family protein [Alphaproteobacteria bacterium]
MASNREGPKLTVLPRYASTAAAGLLLAGCAVLTPLPRETSLEDRLAVFPTQDLPLEGAVVIHWNDHQVPFIEATTDRDAAFALGLVHAHLRLGQMAVMRRIAQGRLAEIVGPIAADIDLTLRIIDFGRAAPTIVARMPADTRAWLDAFVAGVNHYQASVAALPHEYRLLGLEREPWTAADVMTVGRLASTDVNWFIWFRLLRLRDRPDWPALWSELLDMGTASIPSYGDGAGEDVDALTRLLAGVGKSGSNSLAVGASHSATGGALIATDPHLSVSLPNLWLLVGYKSPSYHTVGLMIPGIPFVAVGRNPRIAWGGTNLRAASSDLFDLALLGDAAITAREERVGQRWWFDRRVTLRDSELGPVISDSPQFALDGPVALRWLGHRPSDELTAMLGVNRAGDWDEFRAALDGFALSSQNMIYADADGHVGQLMAVHLPRRPNGRPPDLVLPPTRARAWDRIVTASELPQVFDPPEGFIASANNRGALADVPIGYFFSSNDRIVRLTELLRNDGAPVTPEDLMALQRDVYMHSAVRLRDEMAAHMDDAVLSDHGRRVAALVSAWDGHYAAESPGALAFEQVAVRLARARIEPFRLSAYGTAGRLFDSLADDLRTAPPGETGPALTAALEAAAPAVERFGVWGEMHRLRLAHSLGNVPVIGRRYRFGDVPAGGSSSTVMKTAHPLTEDRHNTSFGANARHVSDLSDPDANYFVLLGGQDGWFNSSTFLDQFELWQRGDYIQMPLRPQTVHATFGHRMTLTP